MTKKRIIWLIIIIAVIISGYLMLRKKPVSPYTTEAATRGNLKQTVSSTGTLKAEQEIDLNDKAVAKIDSILVNVGDAVKKGQLLAVIDQETLPEQLVQARANFVTQKQTLINMKRRDDLYNGAQVEAQRAVVDSAQAGIDSILTQIANTKIISPIDGIVTQKNGDVGELTSLTTPILTVASPGQLHIESNISESDIAKVAVGQTAQVTFDAFGQNQIFNATVTDIDPAATVISDVVYYRVKLNLDNNDPRLKSGMSANVDILTAEKDNVLMIPQRAVKTDNNGQQYVDVLIGTDVKTQTTQRKNVETGLSGDDGMIEIKSGLNEGDKVVTFTKAS